MKYSVLKRFETGTVRRKVGVVQTYLASLLTVVDQFILLSCHCLLVEFVLAGENRLVIAWRFMLPSLTRALTLIVVSSYMILSCEYETIEHLCYASWQ